MKKIVVLIIAFFMGILPVYAKDTVYSINRYSDEIFDSILKSFYNDKNDGYVMSGTFSKKEKVEDGDDFSHKQVMTVKYKKNGEVGWSYHYGKTGDDEFYQMVYSYDEEKKINGYVLFIKESVEKDDNPSDQIIYVFLDLDGKFVKEENSNIFGKVNSVIELYEDNSIVGYLVSGIDCDNHAFMTKLDCQFHTVWSHTYQDYSSIEEIITINQMIYALSMTDQSYQLLRFDSNGNFVSVIKDGFDEIDVPHIVACFDHFILYGYTDEVKIGKRDASSYYLNQFDLDGNLVWETVGSVAVDSGEILELQPIIEEDTCKEYQLLYINSSDRSIEIVIIDTDGIIHNKIKKIKNDYYHINSFLSENNVLYFIGQINCPDDDNCDYDSNSLFLISNEDKVIEVKDNDSKTILIVFAIFLVLCFLGTTFLRKKRKLVG